MGHAVIATNTQVLRQITRSLHAIFRNELENPTKGFEKAMRFMMEVTSTADSEDYNWLGAIPAMEEWIDKRPHTKLSQFGQTIRNADYANGVQLPLNWIDDDKLGQMTPRVKSLAEAYYKHVFRQFIGLIQLGATDLCYDGVEFFSAAHEEVDSGVQSNYDAAGVVLSAANVEAAWSRMEELVDDSGELLNIEPTHIWTTPAQKVTALEIVAAERVGGGDSNMTKKLGLSEDVITVPGLGAARATWWGLVDLGKSMKPFIKQNRRALSFTAMDKIDDELIYSQREVRYGADYRGGYGYGFWQTMHMSTGA